jgi:hypothetical protein
VTSAQRGQFRQQALRPKAPGLWQPQPVIGVAPVVGLLRA